MSEIKVEIWGSKKGKKLKMEKKMKSYEVRR